MTTDKSNGTIVSPASLDYLAKQIAVELRLILNELLNAKSTNTTESN
jgi:hypothetical protein